MIVLRQRNALRGVRLIVYDSVRDYIYRAAKAGQPCDTAEHGLR
jgi:hypothetical protein